MKLIKAVISKFDLQFKRLMASSATCPKKTENFFKICDESKIRNVGICAHIDAGKTTTTERMLYYSGKISKMGEVHCGNTVTDFLEQERNRGITIKSASVSFPWNKHIINLVDTPGHIDFTMEVEQSINIIDSAVIILDASSGVEAQTVTVWDQLNKRKLPRLIYANKFDRMDADIEICLKSLKDNFSVQALPIHFPIQNNGKFEGVIDLVYLNEILWSKENGMFVKKNITNSHPLFGDAIEKRNFLTDISSSIDDTLAEIVMSRDSLEDVTSEELNSAIIRVTKSQSAVPVFCGSSYKNIGIQTLLDGIINYLPSPLEITDYKLYQNFRNQLAARAFKIMHDKQKGSITYFRMYNGRLQKSQKVYNVNQDKSEQIGRVFIPFGIEFEEVQNIGSGSIVAVTGLREISIGDLICDSAVGLKEVKKNITTNMKLSVNEIDGLLQVNTHIPEPVFFCSVEPPSQAHQSSLERALTEIQREDPSLRVTYNSHSGQIELAGMGELHLEVVKERLRSEYKIDVFMGKIQILYKEQLLSDAEESLNFKQNIGTHSHSVSIKLSLHRGERKDVLILDNRNDSATNLAHLLPYHILAIRRGVISAFNHGPLLSCPVIDAHAVLHSVELSRGTSDTTIVAAVSQCITKVLQVCGTRLVEPIMSVAILIKPEHLNIVLSELSQRRSTILSIESANHRKELKCETPLAELLGFAKILRTLTSGSANFTLSFLCYRQMAQEDQEKVIKMKTAY